MKFQWMLGVVVSMLPAIGGAQEAYPSRPIRMVVAFTAGSSTDLMARIVANQMSVNLKQPVIVENRPGAGGAIAAGYVAKAPADGYTVLAHSGSYVIAPWLYKNLPYDPQRDLVSIAALGGFPGVVLVPAGKYPTLSDLLATSRKTSGGLNFASAGTGSSTHMSAEKLNMVAKISGQHIPFRGTPEAITDVAAVAITSRIRSSLLPNVPTIGEAGLPGAEYPLWVGAFAPSKTPPAIVARLHQEIARATQSSEVKKQYAANGIEDLSMTQPKFAQFIRDEIALSGELAKRANLHSE